MHNSYNFMHFSMPAGISHLSNEQFPRQTAEQNENILTVQMKVFFYQQQHMQRVHDSERDRRKKKKIPRSHNHHAKSSDDNIESDAVPRISMNSYNTINSTHSQLSLWFSSIRKRAHMHSQSPGHANRPDENSTMSFHRDLSRINTQQFLPRGLIIPGEYDETSCNMASHFFPRNPRYLLKIKQNVQ